MSHVIQAIFHWISLRTKVKQKDEESASLLGNDRQPRHDDQSALIESNPNYGSAPAAKTDPSGQDSQSDQKSDKNEKIESEETSKKGDTFVNYVRRFCIFIPYVWPYNKPRLQWNMVGVILCLIATRFLKVLGPRQLGIVVNKLAPGHLPVFEFLLYLLFNFIESSVFLDTVRSLLWYPIEMNARKTITTSAYSHVMQLSRDFHDNKKSGELYKSIEQGASIADLLENVFFDFLPIIVDLLVACGYLSYLFGGYMVMIVGGSTIFYLWASKYFLLKQVDMYRDRAAAAREENQRLLDSVGGWISVTYFNNSHYELGRFMGAVEKTLQATWKCICFSSMVNIAKDSILQIGFIGACFIAVYRVSVGQSSVGTFVVLLSYWANFTCMPSFLDFWN